ncbi:hypothetical protein EDB86DRAFT_2833243 [Lactarius hatsudake]|nr:hypothetical protein EDB86DRAFT_2833243 [Lactarius hatsudake]
MAKTEVSQRWFQAWVNYGYPIPDPIPFTKGFRYQWYRYGSRNMGAVEPSIWGGVWSPCGVVDVGWQMWGGGVHKMALVGGCSLVKRTYDWRGDIGGWQMAHHCHGVKYATAVVWQWEGLRSKAQSVAWESEPSATPRNMFKLSRLIPMDLLPPPSHVDPNPFHRHAAITCCCLRHLAPTRAHRNTSMDMQVTTTATTWSTSTATTLWRTRISMMRHARSITTPTHCVQVVTLPMVSPMDPENKGGNNDNSEGGEDSEGDEDGEGGEDSEGEDSEGCGQQRRRRLYDGKVAAAGTVAPI